MNKNNGNNSNNGNNQSVTNSTGYYYINSNDQANHKTNIGDIAYMGSGFIYINKDFNNNTPNITTNTINVNLNQPSLSDLIGKFLLPGKTTWANINSDTNKNWGLQVQINQNTLKNNYYFDITKINVKNNLITFNNLENITISSAEAWPLTISINTIGKAPIIENF